MRIIPGFSEYLVTNDGQVFNNRGRLLASWDCNGYRRISLKQDNGKRCGIDVHRLVVLAWIGPIPKGYWVNHENGDRADNRIENLRADTPSYNHRHAFDVLKRRPGTLKNRDRIEAMQALRDIGWSTMRIAKAFECSQPNVSRLLG